MNVDLHPDAAPGVRAVAVLNLVLGFLRLHPKAAASPSPASTLPPTPVAPPAILPVAHVHVRIPLSASTEKLVLAEDERRTVWSLARDASAPVLLILFLFPLSSAAVVWALSTLPVSTGLPRTLAELAQLGRDLQHYADSGPGALAHILFVLSITACWKHAWSVPGSVLLNILAGVLLNPVLATIYMTLLTAAGSMFSSLLALPLAPLLAHLFPKALDMTRSALQGDAAKDNSSTPAWVRLSVLRLVGVVPWSGINVACGVCGVALSDCLLGALLGTLPWTAVTVQAGDIIQGLAGAQQQRTMSDMLSSPAVLVKLAFLTLLAFGPILARDRLRGVITHPDKAEIASPDADSDVDGDKKRAAERRWPAWMAHIPLRRSRSWSTSSSSRWSADGEFAEKDCEP